MCDMEVGTTEHHNRSRDTTDSSASASETPHPQSTGMIVPSQQAILDTIAANVAAINAQGAVNDAAINAQAANVAAFNAQGAANVAAIKAQCAANVAAFNAQVAANIATMNDLCREVCGELDRMASVLAATHNLRTRSSNRNSLQTNGAAGRIMHLTREAAHDPAAVYVEGGAQLACSSNHLWCPWCTLVPPLADFSNKSIVHACFLSSVTDAGASPASIVGRHPHAKLPKTWKALGRLTGNQCNCLLFFYGLPRDGTVSARRER